jgi:serine/threonine-protein kinase
MKCLKCFEEVPEGNFCDQCGNSLVGEMPQSSSEIKETVILPVTEVSEEFSPPKNYIPDKYELLREIGRGGMGIVYEAIDKKLNRRVVIKCLKEEIAIKERIKKEFIESCKRVARLDEHPNIVKIYEFFEQDNKIYVVFEYVEGRNLDSILDEKGKLSLKEAIAILLPVLDALSFAHERNIIHRDLKPSNIIITKDGKVKVIDFDIARELKNGITRASGVQDTSGTVVYMSPEQELGSYDERADIYSLGVCFYEMLTGELPFKGPNFLVQKERMMFKKPSEIEPSLQAQVDEIILKCLQADKEKRYNSIQELLNELQKM